MAKVVSQKFFQSSFPPLNNNSDSSSTTPSSKANLFASVFASNSNLDDQGVQPHHFPPSKFTMSSIKFSTRKVCQTLLQLDTSKSKGPDGIPAIVLKTCAPELAPILNKLFQLSYTLGTFPTSRLINGKRLGWSQRISRMLNLQFSTVNDQVLISLPFHTLGR